MKRMYLYVLSSVREVIEKRHRTLSELIFDPDFLNRLPDFPCNHLFRYKLLRWKFFTPSLDEIHCQVQDPATSADLKVTQANFL